MAVEKYLDLPEEIEEKFDILSDEAYEDFTEKNYKTSFQKYEQCLQLIPEPKKEYGESSNVIEWMIENYLIIEEYNKAIEWVEKLGLFLKNQEILGDWEFLKGKVFFESKDFEKSLKNFKISFAKTNGTCFIDQDPKYKDFYLHPEKYIKD